MSETKVCCDVTAIPLTFPDAVALEAREVNAVSGEPTGREWAIPARPWAKVQEGISLTRPEDAEIIRSILAGGQMAYMGRWWIDVADLK